jgi:hypothetical protein
VSSKHPTPQPRDIVRESFYFQTLMRNKNGIEHTVLLYEDGTMTCSCPYYGTVKAIQCAHIQRACADFILNHPTDHEMQERIVEMKSEARKADIGRHNVALGIFRSRNAGQDKVETYEEIARRESSEAYARGRHGDTVDSILGAFAAINAGAIAMPASIAFSLSGLDMAEPQPQSERKQAREPERLPKKPPTEPVRRKFDFDP